MAKSLEGFLNNLQDWELSLEDKDKKKLKSQVSHGENPVSSSRKIALASEDITSSGRTSSRDYSSNSAGKYDYGRRYGSTTHIPSTFMSEENSPDAVSEKELGNEYFKQKKFKEAVDCYSRSIALSPTAVAYANRAMAFLKIRKFQEAEDDCTEALNLDDRYIKAYSRRATARKQLGKLKESIEDSEFALRMEPGNQEIVKQIAETKSLYKKENLEKISRLQRSPVDRAAVSRVSEIIGTSATQIDSTSQKERDNQFPVKTSVPVGEIQSKKVEVLNQNRIQKAHHKQLGPSMQQLASRAASQALSDAARSITPPTSAYRFEVSWRALASDPSLQAHLLKAVEPNALPQIFKNSLSAPILVGIVKCVASFFTEEMDLAIKYLDNLTKVARFDMIMMCLSYTDRTDILNLWNEVFFGQSTQSEYAEILDKLRPRYCSR